MRRPLATLVAALALAALAGCGSASELPRAAEPARSPEPTERPAGRAVALGNRPEGLVADSATGLVAAGLADPDRLLLLDGRTGKVRRRVPLPGAPRHLALAEEGARVLVPAGRANALLEVPLAGGPVSATRVGRLPHGVAVVDGRAWVADEGGSTLSAVEDGRLVDRVRTATQPEGIVDAGPERLAVVAARDRTVSVFDTTTGKELSRAPAGIGPTHLAADEGTRPGRLWVVDTRGGSLLYFHLRPRLELVRRIHLPGSPYGIAIDRRRERLWVTLTATNQLVELPAHGRPRKLRYLPTVRQPNSVAVNEATGNVYIASKAAGTLQIVNPSSNADRAGADGGDSASLLANPPPEAGPARSHARSSRALGTPQAGRLLNSVRLPREGKDHFTWDPVKHRSPNRPWRLHGTDRLVRTLLTVLRAHPGRARVGVGDLSRRTGGDFGRRFGPLGHASHQNGLDADVYYPRRDGAERAARHPGQVDRRHAQQLVDAFVRAGAEHVFVGPRVNLDGPRGVVQVAPHHDDHLHVRLPARP